MSEVSGPSSPEPDPDVVVGLLAEDDRLRAVAALALGAATVDEVQDMAGLDARRATAALERLAAGGLVVQADDGRGLRLASERFKEAARRAAEVKAAAAPPDEFAGVPADAAAVLRSFVKGGRLERIPAAKGKRRVVLDWLAQRFEIGQVYPEAAVNLELGKVHADVAALRRYLVDEGFLERREGFYWRAGGTTDV